MEGCDPKEVGLRFEVCDCPLIPCCPGWRTCLEEGDLRPGPGRVLWVSGRVRDLSLSRMAGSVTEGKSRSEVIQRSNK